MEPIGVAIALKRLGYGVRGFPVPRLGFVDPDDQLLRDFCHSVHPLLRRLQAGQVAQPYPQS